MPTAQAPAPKGHNQPPPLKEILAENYATLAAEVDAIAARANGAPKKVANDDDLDAVGVIVKDVKALAKRADNSRTTEKEPHLTAGREIDAFFKTMTERLDRIASTLGERATAYQRAKAEEARRAAEELARKEREREAEARRKAAEAEEAGKASAAGRHEGRAEAAAARAEGAEAEALASAAELTRRRGASGTIAGAKSVQKVRIVDIAKLNLGPLGPYIDREAIQKAANAWLRVSKGTEQMPGLEVYDDVTATFR